MIEPQLPQAVLQVPDILSSSIPASPFKHYKNYKQPLCGDREGWGPASPILWDLTPCAEDAIITAVAAFGILFGSGAIWYLVQKKRPEPIAKNWHFHAKLLLLIGIIVANIAQAGLVVHDAPKIWPGDIRFWANIAVVVSLAVIFNVQFLEHRRSRTPNGVVLFYWLLYIIFHAIKLRSLVEREAVRLQLPYFIAFVFNLGLATFEFILEWLVPKRASIYEAISGEQECPYNYADVFSVLSFGWITPLMRYGYKNYLKQEDLWDLRTQDRTRTNVSDFEEQWEEQLQKKRPSLWIAIIRAYGGPFLIGSAFKVGSDTLAFVQPQLLRLLITFVESYRTSNESAAEPAARGAAIALGMFAVSVAQTVCLHQYFQRAFETGMRIKSGMTSAIYKKSLRLSSEGRAEKSTGDIVNHMAVDTQRLQDLAQFGTQLWSAPFQMVLCMLSLYQLVGFSMFAGIAAMVAMVPLNWVIARFMKRLQKEQMGNKDARARLTTEILNNMKSIKLYAWSTAFLNKLNFIRNEKELVTLRKIGASQAVANFLWSSTPFLVSCSTFMVFVFATDVPLTTDIVFPALTLFNLLTFPLVVLPMVISAIIEASVAIERLSKYYLAEELQRDAVISKPTVDRIGETSVQITKGTFSWNKFEEGNVLEDINFTARKGELSCIVGRVGAGKSSFLEAILGDLYKAKGYVVVRGAVAYVAQSPWVMNASVKENILFGHRYDAHFYELTVKACALLDDFKALPDGDDTEVGERGISLSGGQRARLTLARAVYARADIYLLDDVLSAVDGHVGRHIIDEVLGPRGLLKSKTRILATNSVPVLAESDYIVLLENKTVAEEGKYDALLAKSESSIAAVVRMAKTDEQNQVDDAPAKASKAEADAKLAAEDEELLEEVEEQEEEEQLERETGGLADLPPSRPPAAAGRKASELTLRRASTVSFRGPRGKLTDEEDTGARSKQSKEVSEQGKVKWSVYIEYAKANNISAVLVYLVTLIGAQTAQVGGNVWLKQWSEANERVGGNPDIGKWLGGYFGFGIGGAALVVVQTLILWIFCSIEASRKLHERMAVAMFRSPMSFFETTPSGRVLNRFSSDIYKVDEILARSFNMLFTNASRALFTLVVISVSTPAFIALILPIALMYLYIQRYYLRTSRELKRLESVSRSPIFAHFQESLQGVNTIRAYRQQTRFTLENEWRMDSNVQAYFPSITANRWLAVRLEFIGSIIILAAAGFAIISVTTGSGISAGLVGLSMSYALQITQSLNWIVRQTVEVETNIVSVERVLEYARLPSERPEINPDNRPAASWPSQGAVTFRNYSTRYREGLDLVLRDINVAIRPKEKIGVVGRTGAGKSSLTLALFRLIEPAGGQIEIDEMNSSSVGLMDLRRRLAIIPQDAALFEGTVRDNLDPDHVHDDGALWSVLGHARLRAHVEGMKGQLEAKINEGGGNLSQGQRQLVSLARALLTPSSILVLDEATAAVDVQTDALLQETLRSAAFGDRTIVAIAHRINTILDSDRILVLEQGRVAEFDTPAALMRAGGLFAKLVREAGLADSVPGA